MSNKRQGVTALPTNTKIMRIEQITITKIIAEDGKILKRKNDGHYYGTEVTLGYNYYEAGVILSQPKLETPDDYEEVDMPEKWEERPIIDHVKRLKRANELVQKNHEEINTLGLTDEQALEVKEMFPMWNEFVDKVITTGTRFQYEGNLYEVLQDHTVLSHYQPSINTAALYKEVVLETNEEGELNGTIENPIPYEGNMVIENGKYYSQDGVTYLCTRDSGNPVYHALKDLVGLYVEAV